MDPRACGRRRCAAPGGGAPASGPGGTHPSAPTLVKEKAARASSAAACSVVIGLFLIEVEIDPLPQFLARLEVRHVLLGHLHLLARLRIAARSRRTIVQAEAAEPADLDALALREAFSHRVEDHLDRQLGILGNQLRKLRREAVDQLRFGHEVYPALNRWSCCRASPSAMRRGSSCPCSFRRFPRSSAALPLIRRHCPSP